MFGRYLRVLYWLAKHPSGLTAGEVAKRTPGMSKGQVERLLDDLQIERHVIAEMQPHGRTGKRVFALSERARKDFAELSRIGLQKAVQS